MNGTYDSWKTTDTTDTGNVEDECPRDCEGCPVCKPDDNNPEPTKDEDGRISPPLGSYAATAREMAKLFPDFDWDNWKDEMKEGEF